MGLQPLKTLLFWFSLRLLLFSLVLFCIFSFLKCCLSFVKTFGKTKNKKKTNPYPRVGLKPLKTLFVWFSLRFLLFLWFYFVYLVFSNDFCCCKNLRGNQQNKKDKPISKGGSETFSNFVFVFCFTEGLLVFCGFILHCLFSRRFCWLWKPSGKQKNKKQKNISKGGSETFETLFFGFPEGVVGFLWFSLVFLVSPKLFQGGLDA